MWIERKHGQTYLKSGGSSYQVSADASGGLTIRLVDSVSGSVGLSVHPETSNSIRIAPRQDGTAPRVSHPTAVAPARG